MHLQRTIRRDLRRLAQLYSDAAQAHTAHGRIPAATNASGPLDEARRVNGRRFAEPEGDGARHG
ncbi:hypothetical protein [Actinacidiphila sp. bgisy167]|uniref:hypothetical protein n=1 Tax=Actinacidiphila sp. bgisy167 TaxID=3413797 RepID=UPI003D755D2B